jgi:hypothetical protein
MRHHKYMPIALLAATFCPSVCGWNAELINREDAEALNKEPQNAEVNTGSRSETMDTKIPWRIKTLSAFGSQ